MPHCSSLNSKRFLALQLLTCLGMMLGSALAFARSLEKGGFISDTHGAIQEIVLHYDQDLDAALTPLYVDLFSAMRDDVDIRVMCRSAAEMRYFVDNWGPLATLGGRRLEVIDLETDLTIWARDRYVPRQSHDLERALPGFVPREFIEYELPKINEIQRSISLAQVGLIPPVLDSTLQVEGGNIVSSQKYVFVGANIFTDNHDPSRDESAVIDEFRRIAGRPVFIVQALDGSVPWCHIDMYITPIGNNTVVVADIELGRQLIQESGVVLDSFEASSVISRQLDEIAQNMSSRGLIVHRLPAVANAFGDWMITYNNVLIDQATGRDMVLMPVYGQPILDDYAKRFFLGLGFFVSPIDVSHIYELGGALRCVTNVTRRAAVEPRGKAPYSERL